jgi:hypothetical protein
MINRGTVTSPDVKTQDKDRFGVESICTVLTEFGIKIAPSTYYAARARPASARAVRDEELKKEIQRVYDENYRVYGARKVWWQLQRDGITVGRCRVERLMRAMGLAGAVRGKTVRTTVSDKDGVTRSAPTGTCRPVVAAER